MPEISFASLSPSLLARKGGAKPAMRPQHAALATMPNADAGTATSDDAEKLEDLGWNDMGSEPDDGHRGAEIVALGAVHAPGLPAMPFAEPEVLRQREDIAERLAPAASPRAMHAPEAPRMMRPARKNRAAFTLRLDTERHIKLRLACTMRDTSAQSLVTQALDAFLAGMPELDALAAQLKRR